ncbi:MAG: SDR family oxidoreductase [Nanoarchaeota archaeon]
MKTILITGASGLLGYNLINDFLKHQRFYNYKIYGTYFNNPIYSEKCIGLKLDLRNGSDVKKIIEEVKPEVIIHCAAMTDVDRCEKERDECYNTNVTSTINLCNYKPHKAKLIYISTDAVYEGKTGNYSENSETQPVNYYGRTKLEAEKIVMQLENYTILRVNIFGTSPAKKLSLAEWFIKKLRNKEKLNGFSDIYFNPILVNNLSEIIIETIERDIIGLYNVGSPNTMSKYDFGLKIAEIFNFDKDLINKSLSKDINFIAERPKNSTMNISKVREKYNTKLQTIEEGLITMKRIKIE